MNTAPRRCAGSRRSSASSAISLTGCGTPRTRPNSTSSWRNAVTGRPRRTARRNRSPSRIRGNFLLRWLALGRSLPDQRPPDAASSDLSIFTLFWQAHWIVKSVMIGLMACSVWVWAIAVDKLILYARTTRAMDGFEQTLWSGQSLEELYRMVSARPNHSMAALFVAAMREWKRSFEGPPRSFAGLQMRIEKVMDVTS